ncbi:hypothetical protein AMAG_02139 [Allomyces macrogynus ATCC 38327]|uniref:Uncharacterized protein n=2 Tax=Allomyces macrogynus (strain ATCC 38327) TaxID=578462 RepID=A0A0L0S149_ALLM3|nr:hypothetical protein AMAG_02139 [Allomyces macrogynus ATCC 38327]|eukprot:KNE56317.1 hypothetical protein AMAG_02139 [Allomyces macrogynus ATCC 38327]
MAASRSVLSVEIDLRERLSQAPAAPHEARVRACMECLEEFVAFAPTLGPMVSTIKQELEGAIYSNQLTLSPQLTSDVEAVTNLDKIPWFVLVTRLGDMRREEIDSTRETLADLTHKVKIRERDIALLQKRSIASKQELQDRDDTISSLNARIAQLEQDLVAKLADMDELKRDFQAKLDAVNHDKDTLELSLNQANATIERLSVFKTAKDANDDQLSARIWVTEKRELLVPEPVHVTEVSIKEAETLQRQLHDIANNHIDDLEAAMLQIRKKREILGTSGANDDDIEQQHLLHEFELSMAQLQQEQALLGEHILALQASLAKYRDTAECMMWRTHAGETQRKYAVTLYVSTDGGNVFRVWKDSPFCAKCADRVIVCPHMHSPGCLDRFHTLADWTVPVPTGATHLQFRRPNLLIQVPAKVLINDSFAITDDEHEDYVDMKLHRASRYFKVIWHDFFNRRHHARPVLPRVFTIDKLVRLMCDMYDARWQYEAASIDHTMSFMDFFHEFLGERYRVPAVASRVAFEALSALEHHQESNHNINLFVRHLAGSEECTWKYTRLMFTYVSLLEPFDLPRFRKMLHTLYPHRTDALYEYLELEQLGYAAQAAAANPNAIPGAPAKITGESVREQLKTLLRRRRDPNHRAFKRLLAKYDVLGANALARDVFLDAMHDLVPQTPREIAAQHYAISEHDYGVNRVGIDRLAEIVAFMFANQCHAAGWGIPGVLAARAKAQEESLAPSLDEISHGSDGPSKGASKAKSKPPAMPIVAHLADELAAYSKLEADEDEDADTRRIELGLTAASTNRE